MYPWTSRTLDFWLQFCEKKCSLYMDVYGNVFMVHVLYFINIKSHEWTTADSQKDCSMANFQHDSAHLAGQKCDTKTLWKNLTSAVTCPTPHGKRELKTVLHGAHLWEREFWPSKTTASVRKISFAREERKRVQILNLPPSDSKL